MNTTLTPSVELKNIILETLETKKFNDSINKYFESISNKNELDLKIIEVLVAFENEASMIEVTSPDAIRGGASMNISSMSKSDQSDAVCKFLRSCEILKASYFKLSTSAYVDFYYTNDPDTYKTPTDIKFYENIISMLEPVETTYEFDSFSAKYYEQSAAFDLNRNIKSEFNNSVLTAKNLKEVKAIVRVPSLIKGDITNVGLISLEWLKSCGFVNAGFEIYNASLQDLIFSAEV